MLVGKLTPGATPVELPAEAIRASRFSFPAASRVAKLSAYLDALGYGDQAGVVTLTDVLLDAADSSAGFWATETVNMVLWSEPNVGMSGWLVSFGAGGAGSITRITNDLPAQPALLGATAVAEFAITANIGNWAFLQAGLLPATFVPGALYQLSFWARWISGTTSWRAQLTDQTSLNALMPATNFVPTSAWQRFVFPFVPPIAGNQPIVFVFPTTGALGVVRVGAVQVERASYPSPYVLSMTGAPVPRRLRASAQVPIGNSYLDESQGWAAFRVAVP